MPGTRSKAVSLRMSEESAARLKAMAGRENLSQAALVERLLREADDDPAGYYMRAAAIHGWTALTLLTVLVNQTFGDQTPEILKEVGETSRGLFGRLPAVPREVARLQRVDPRVRALLDAYGAPK